MQSQNLETLKGMVIEAKKNIGYQLDPHGRQGPCITYNELISCIATKILPAC